MLFLAGILLVCSAGFAAGPQRAEITKSELSLSALPIGHKAWIAVQVEIKPGFHAQSHEPLDPLLKKFSLTMTDNPSLSFGEAKYPPGKVEDYPKLGKLSVYTGTVTVYVPVETNADAKPGAIQIAGKVAYQICDDNECFMPEKKAFTIDTRIVTSDTAVQPNDPDFFKEIASSGPMPTAPQPEVIAQQPAVASAAFQFFLAFLAGIVFNIVPCVLPVLPLKAIGFYEASQHSRVKSLSFGIAFSLGLIATFAVFGVLIFGYSWIGFHDRPFDWGQLFTKPWFTAAIVLILLGMAAQTFGAFAVGIPKALYGVSPRHDTYWGNFLFGILTALLSTPCTFGMFVGLLAWAITQPPAIGVLILVTVGAGMAFPYLVLSALPEVARRFPRTGPWAELVKQMMGFLLLLAAVYFARPFLSRIVPGEAFWWLPFAVIVAAAAYLVFSSFHLGKSIAPRVSAIALAALMIGGSLRVALILTERPFQWTPYSTTALANAEKSGRIALVEFTADWCGNCQYVEAHVLHSHAVVATVKSHDILMLKADVTRDDAPARPLLEKLNPAGSIPLTVIYVPNSKQPIELTGIYSQDDLVRAIENAAQGSPESVAIR